MPFQINESLRRELRYLFPAWIFCVLLPMPLILFWHSPLGRSYGVMCFSVGCATLVAYSFRRDIGPSAKFSVPAALESRTWHERMLPLGLVLLAAFAVFAMLSLAVNDAQDFVTPLLAFMVLLPTLGIVPYMTMVTRHMFGGILFSVFLVGSLKTPIGAMIIHAFFNSRFEQKIDTDGSLIMPTPWTHPNLLVWWIYGSTAMLSFLFCFLGARRFRAIHAPVGLADNAVGVEHG